MPLHARRLLRKMRGGAQAHLVEADDGNFYVVKFKNNPQHRRILINELVAGVFLRYLEISTPESAMIQVVPAFLEAYPDASIRLGAKRFPVEAGWHFGSRFPGHPDRMAIYDYVPDVLLTKVANLTDFLGVLVFDKWVGNADARQAIFYRARLRESAVVVRDHVHLGFVALMVDHGYIFNGPHWGFVDSPLNGLYHRPAVYANVRSYDDFQPWLDRVVDFPEEIVDEALRQIPQQWLDEGELEELESLLERLLLRRRRVPELIRACVRGRINPFPNWR